jgi:hypothetical protein
MIAFKNETFEKKSKKLNFWSLFPISATIYEVKITFWKELEDGAPMTYIQIDIFWFYMLWGIQNQFCCEVIWVNLSLSMIPRKPPQTAQTTANHRKPPQIMANDVHRLFWPFLHGFTSDLGRVCARLESGILN